MIFIYSTSIGSEEEEHLHTLELRKQNLCHHVTSTMLDWIGHGCCNLQTHNETTAQVVLFSLYQDHVVY